MKSQLLNIKPETKLQIQYGEQCYIQGFFNPISSKEDDTLVGHRLIQKLTQQGQPTGREAKMPIAIRIDSINSIEFLNEVVDITPKENNLIIVPDEQTNTNLGGVVPATKVFKGKRN